MNASEKCLRGNPAWERAFQLCGRLLELRQPDSLVSAKIYNPLQIPVSLHKLIVEKDPRYLPAMEAVSSKDGADTLILAGFLAWSGRAAVSLVPCTTMAEDSLVRCLIQHRALVTELVNELDEVSGFA